MTLDELIQAFRDQADDARTPFLWSDEEVIRYLNEAAREACERAELIYDEESEASTISFEAEQSSTALHESVFDVSRVVWDGKLLSMTTRESLDRNNAQWSAMIGQPTHFFTVPGISSLVLGVYPKHSDAIDLTLGVYRRPLVDMEGLDDVPEMHTRHHFRLVDWALSLAYRKEDEETKDIQKAERHERAFSLSFGPSVDEHVRHKWSRKRMNTVQMNPGW
jgi:hypothetical protein